MVLNIAGVAHGIEYWKMTEAILDELKEKGELESVALEVPAKYLKDISRLSSSPQKRAIEYIKFFPSQVKGHMKIIRAIHDIIKTGGIENISFANKKMLATLGTKKEIELTAGVSSLEYTLQLINYCKSHRIKLLPLGKTSYTDWGSKYMNSKSPFKIYTAKTRAEEDIAIGIIKANASLNLLGSDHVLSVFALVKKYSKQPVKLLFCYNRGAASAAKRKTILFGRIPSHLTGAVKKVASIFRK